MPNSLKKKALTDSGSTYKRNRTSFDAGQSQYLA